VGRLDCKTSKLFILTQFGKLKFEVLAKQQEQTSLMTFTTNFFQSARFIICHDNNKSRASVDTLNLRYASAQNKMQRGRANTLMPAAWLAKVCSQLQAQRACLKSMVSDGVSVAPSRLIEVMLPFGASYPLTAANDC
jgi:hypothetical protein